MSFSSCSRIRAQAFSIFTAINWLSNFFIGLFTLSAIEAMGAWTLPGRSRGDDDLEEIHAGPSPRDQQKAGVAGLYAVFSLLSVLTVAFVYLFVRETMGKSLEELEEGGGRGVGVGAGDGEEGVALRLAKVQDDDQDFRFGLLEGSELDVDSGDEGEDACRVVL